MNTVAPIIRKIVLEFISVDEFQPHDNLFDLGLDSISLMTLITQLEANLMITFPLEEMQLDNFSTLNSLTDLCGRVGNSPNYHVSR